MTTVAKRSIRYYVGYHGTLMGTLEDMRVDSIRYTVRAKETAPGACVLESARQRDLLLPEPCTVTMHATNSRSRDQETDDGRTTGLLRLG